MASSNCIYMALDRNYERYAKPCLNSLFTNWQNHPDIFLFTNDISDDFKSWLNGRVKIVSYDNIELNMNLGPVNNKIVYTKYNCWNPRIFSNYEHVLHLDCDTVILKPLDHLFQGESIFIDNNEVLDGIKAFKNIKNIKMCNAGVFVVAKKHITEEHYSSLIELTKDLDEECLYADQSIISMWCKMNDVAISENVYSNFQPQFINYKNNNYDFDKIEILHFAARKPDTIAFNVWWRCDGWQSKFFNIWSNHI